MLKPINDNAIKNEIFRIFSKLLLDLIKKNNTISILITVHENRTMWLVVSAFSIILLSKRNVWIGMYMKNTIVTKVEIKNDLVFSLIIFFIINEKIAMPERNMKNTGITSVIVISGKLSLYGTNIKNTPNKIGLKKRIFEDNILTGFSICSNI